jgi:hypothetical protein
MATETTPDKNAHDWSDCPGDAHDRQLADLAIMLLRRRITIPEYDRKLEQLNHFPISNPTTKRSRNDARTKRPRNVQLSASSRRHRWQPQAPRQLHDIAHMIRANALEVTKAGRCPGCLFGVTQDLDEFPLDGVLPAYAGLTDDEAPRGRSSAPSAMTAS